MQHTPVALVVSYYAIGGPICFAHPQLLRELFRELATLELGVAGIFLKPVMALVVALLYCTLWPIAWFNAGKSEKKAQEKLDAQLERLRAFHTLRSAMNAPVAYAGGDGSSFEQAVILVNASLLSGPTAAYKFIEQHYPGYKRGRQSLVKQNERTYDVLEFTTADGQDKTMYFDITDQLRSDK